MGAGARKFTTDTLAVGLAQLVSKLRGIILLPLLVRLLGTDAYGIWSQVIAIAGFASVLCSLNLHAPLVRFSAAEPRQLGENLSTILLAVLALSAVGASALTVVSEPVGQLLIGQPGMGQYVMFSALLLAVTNVELVALNYFRARQMLVTRSILFLCSNVGEVAGAVVLLWSGRGLADVLVFAATWRGLLGMGEVSFALRSTGWCPPRWPTLRKALLYALPLVPAALSHWALDRVDRFVIGSLLGATSLGVYSASYALAGGILLFQAPFQIALLPKVSALWHQKRALAERYIGVSLAVYVTLALPFVTAMAALAEPVLTLLAGPELAAASGWTTALVTAGLFAWGVAVLHFTVFHGTQRTGWIGGVALGAALANLGLNFLLVPRHGVEGAAWATLACYLGAAVVLVGIARRLARPPLQGLWLSAVTFLACLLGLALHYSQPHGWELLWALGGYGLLYILTLGLGLRGYARRRGRDPLELLREMTQ